VDAVAFSPDLVDLAAPSSFQWALRSITDRVSGFEGSEMTAWQRGLTKFLKRFHRHECHLYVGFTVTVLACLGIRGRGWKLQAPKTTRVTLGKRRFGTPLGRSLPWILLALAGSYSWLTSRILLTFLMVFLLLLGGLVLYKRSPSAKRRLKCLLQSLETEHRLYLYMAVWAFAFTFGPVLFVLQRPVFVGPWLPFSMLPGFNVMRHTFRMESVAMLSMSVLAGYGMKRLLDHRFKPARKRVLVSAVALAILAENFSAPLPLTRLRTGRQIPEVYRWIRENVGDDPIVEYPFFADAGVTVAHIPKAWQWIWRVPFVTDKRELASPHEESHFNWVRESLANSYAQYYSIYHWKKLFNGHSAFQPEIYTFLRNRMESFPSKSSIDALEAVGARHLIVHRALCSARDLDRVDRAAKVGLPGLRLIGSFGDDALYEIEGSGKEEPIDFKLHRPERVERAPLFSEYHRLLRTMKLRKTFY
jgi:hypothetical protein